MTSAPVHSPFTGFGMIGFTRELLLGHRVRRMDSASMYALIKFSYVQAKAAAFAAGRWPGPEHYDQSPP
jgi:hypothetical protein